MAVVKLGAVVRVNELDPAWLYVHGWVGEVTGEASGLTVCKFDRPDGVKTLFVPGDLLDVVTV